MIKNQLHTSIAAIVTTLWVDGINLSMLRYRSTSATANFSKLESSLFGSGATSEGSNSPRSGGIVDTDAQDRADIVVHM